MNINDLTIGQLKEINSLLNKETTQKQHIMIGKKVIVRTYYAGVHFGELHEKEGKEVILKNARRLWYWNNANKGISLSETANEGLKTDSKVCSPVPLICLEYVEIIPCSDIAIKNIEGQNEYKA